MDLQTGQKIYDCVFVSIFIGLMYFGLKVVFYFYTISPILLSVPLVASYWFLHAKFISPNAKNFNVIVVGGGLGGMCTAIKLKEKGFNVTIIDQSSEFGGTWLENSYPGSGCDVASILYSFSFAPKSDWKQVWAKQGDIIEYVKFVAKKFQLYQHTKFNCRVSSAIFNEVTKKWTLKTSQGDLISNFVVFATGQLNKPSIPEIPGLETFKGPAFHSARWDSSVSLEGKRVAVLGTGASAVQIIPEIAPKVERLQIFQSTPSHIIPKGDYYYKPWALTLLSLPFVGRLYRWLQYWRYEVLWPNFHQGTFNKLMDDGVRHGMLKEINLIERPEHGAEQLMPKFGAGCKRILVSDDYYPALKRDNVHLTNDKIQRIEGNTLITAKNQYEVDAIVFCTGFKTSEFLSQFHIQGLEKTVLADTWGTYPAAYLGISVPKFPNMFIVYGPHTNLGHNSIIFMLECQANYISLLIESVAEKNAKTIDVFERTFSDYKNALEKRFDKLIWSAACPVWYKNHDNKIINNLPSSTLAYWWKTLSVVPSEYAYGE